MSKTLLLLLFFFSSGCGSKHKLFMPDSTRWTDQDIPLTELDSGRVNTDSLLMIEKMRKAFSLSDTLIEGRPVSFYLNRADVSPVAKNFYLLRFTPSDDDPTAALIDSLTTRNDTTRPFYYFLYVRITQIADGALSEMLPDAAWKYSTEFTDEFYHKLELPLYRSSFDMWVGQVSFLVWNELDQGRKDVANAEDVKKYIIDEHTKSAKHLTPTLRRDIIRFADSVAANPGDGR